MNILDASSVVIAAVAVALLVVSLAKLAFVPFAAWFELRRRVFPRHTAQVKRRDRALVSVIVPAYNEAVVLKTCVESILRSDYQRLEVIVVDDGSTDHTATVMSELATRHPRVRVIHQANAGKGAALNRGMAAACGETLLFVDADGVFSPRTIDRLVAGLSDPDIGAVCGDDRPANPDRPLTQLLSVMSHVGTGVVRRALSLLHCLPIVSGNIGAFRASLIREIGGFREDTIGEDLELTWRIYAAGYRVIFEPRAIVYAESPSTLRGLWKQRVRWARGLLQTTRIHRRLIGSPSEGVFGVFLALNTFSMIIAPPLQLLVLVGVLCLVGAGSEPLPRDAIAVLGWVGLILSTALAVFGILLNGAWRDLRYLWTIPLWPIYSIGMGLTMVAAISHEMRGVPARWNKLPRTGVVTDGVLAGLARSERR